MPFRPYLLSVALVFALVLTAGTAARADEPGSRPNILLIFTDDQNTDTLGCYGNERVRTPHIDRLADTGALFSRAYLTGGNTGALCQPSRAMLMTGRHFPRIAVDRGWDLAPQPTLPTLLREAGYATFMTGKWHNGRQALVWNFPDAGPVLNAGMGDHTSKQVIHVAEGEVSPPAPIPAYSTDAFGESALAFLERRPDSAPFFLYLAFSAPHDPRQPVAPWRDHHEADPPPLPPNFLPLPPFNVGALTVRDEHLAPWPRPEWMIREQTAHYLAMVEHIDHFVGRILEQLKAAGELDNTLIVFLSDNGLAMGGHGLLGKQNPYEHSVRVPLIIAGPGVEPGTRHDGLVSIFDIMPTLLHAVDIEAPGDLDGRSLHRALEGSPEPVRDRLSISEYFGDLECHVLLEGPWKLIRFPLLDKTQLFHLDDDPHEVNDLGSNPAHAERIASMMEALESELRSVGVNRPLHTERRINADFDHTEFVQNMDHMQPAWIRERYTPEHAQAPPAAEADADASDP